LREETVQDLRAVVARRLREVRDAQGLTQRDVAARAGLSLGFVGAVERGRMAATVDTLARLAAALEVGAADLVGGESRAVPRILSHPEERIRALVRGQPADKLELAERVLREVLRPAKTEVTITAAMKHAGERPIVSGRSKTKRKRRGPAGDSAG